MYLWLLLPVSAVLVLLAKLNNYWVEHFFVPFIYRPLSYVVGTLVSLVPFSVTELLLLPLSALLIFYIVRVILKIKKTRRIKRELYKVFVNFVCLVSCALFLFEMCMGLNYYRTPASEYLGLDVRESTVDELYDLCEYLVNIMNESRAKLPTDKNGVALLCDQNREQTSESARLAYKSLAEKYPFLKSADIRNKPLVSSKLFSMVLTTGIYIPYTFESNINVDVPEFTIPATMCHELTHYRGFMREDEANFLGYLACMQSPRADFRYSGAYMAFNYCYSALYNENVDLAKQIANMCDDGIITDVVAEDNYWAPYRNTVVSQVSGEVYDTYLNLNDQQSGLKSYGEMIDLLLAFMRE